MEGKCTILCRCMLALYLFKMQVSLYVATWSFRGPVAPLDCLWLCVNRLLFIQCLKSRLADTLENVNTIRTGDQAFGTSFLYPHHIAPEQKWPRILSSSLLYMHKCEMVQPLPKKYRGGGESGTRASLDVTDRIFPVPCSPFD